MSQSSLSYHKANTLEEVDNAVRLDVPIGPDHPFYTDFGDLRAEFHDRQIYRSLLVNPGTFEYNRSANQGNKITLFLAGMRGSGKTSELTKIASKISHPNAFLVVTCNLDDGLDMNDIQYMDILIFQLERLFQELEKMGLNLDQGIIQSLQGWFSERVKEINTVIKREGGFEIEVGAETPSFFSFLKLTSKLKASLLGSKENATKIRTSFQNNFSDFVLKFNSFLEGTCVLLRQHKKAQDILFIVDGLEKIATSEIRRKIIVEESNRIRQIRANTLFTLPVELVPYRSTLLNFSQVLSFPFVKLKERNGSIVEAAVERFKEFVYKRIDQKLFDSEETVREAILASGGSPRELLRILEYANLFVGDIAQAISRADLDRGIKKLAAETAQYISKEDFERLKELKTANEANRVLAVDDEWLGLIERLVVMEYNDGTYKRVNPLVEASELYKQYVG